MCDVEERARAVDGISTSIYFEQYIYCKMAYEIDFQQQERECMWVNGVSTSISFEPPISCENLSILGVVHYVRVTHIPILKTKMIYMRLIVDKWRERECYEYVPFV